jgi:hypothetical protein
MALMLVEAGLLVSCGEQGVDRDALRKTLRDDPAITEFRESRVSGGLTLFRGRAESRHGVRIRFALLAGDDAGRKAASESPTLLTGVSTSNASAPASNDDLLFITDAERIQARKRRGVAYSLAYDIETRLFETQR